ncbi:MAG: MSMEG_0568 family radical SAM protein, partial [Actinomycetota bacterium]|nr:MSMEG_0568 family radical SAM protein [Actinomycetota bacterium]
MWACDPLRQQGRHHQLHAPPVRRRGGAGPSDDGHVRLGGRGAALPLDPTSPFELVDGRLLYDGVDVGLPAETIARPRFYDLQTADGIPYEQLARLHGESVLASTVIQTCSRYPEETRCRFCAIEESLAVGATTRVKSPAQLAEVAEAAVRLDGITQVVLTTGTTATPDRGARYLARCVAAIVAAVPGLPVQVQCEPPDDPGAIASLAAAGATAIGIHVESLDDSVRRRWMPGKATVPLSAYWAAWDEAVRCFGRNHVSTYLLVGLGEDPDELVAGAQRLIERGVYPFVVPFRPLAGTLAAHESAPAVDVVADVSRRVGAALVAAAMR